MTSERDFSSHETTAVPENSPAQAAGAGAGALTAGQMLRQARERAGLHLASLAAVLKVPPQRLEALEADRYDQLAGMAFVRGLASSMARALKLDVQQVLALLPKTDASTLKQDRVVASVSRISSLPSHSSGYGKRTWITRVLAVVIVLLLVGAAAIVFLPQLQGLLGAGDSQASTTATQEQQDGEGLNGGGTSSSDAAGTSGAASGQTTGTAAQDPSGAPLALTTLAPADLASAASAAPAASAAAGNPDSSAAQPAAAAVPGVTAAPTAQVATADAAASTVNLAPQGVMAMPTSGDVVFQTKGDSWVEVLDGNKLPLLRRTLQSGEKVGVSGAKPLSVVVGNVQNVQVQVLGQDYSLDRYKRGNVARFQVK